MVGNSWKGFLAGAICAPTEFCLSLVEQFLILGRPAVLASRKFSLSGSLLSRLGVTQTEIA